MPRQIELDGTVHQFPDDASDDEIRAALGEGQVQGAPGLATGAGAPPPLGTLPNQGDTGEGQIAQGLTTFERQVGDQASSLLSGLKGPAGNINQRLNNLQNLPSPVATKEGSTAMNLGATAANLLPAALLHKLTPRTPTSILDNLKTYASESAQPQSMPIALKKLIKPVGGPDLSKLPSMSPGQSTTIASHGYEPAGQRMVVQFKNGNVYEYKGVPQEIYDKFVQSESQGSFHASNVKGRYATNRIGQVKPNK